MILRSYRSTRLPRPGLTPTGTKPRLRWWSLRAWAIRLFAPRRPRGGIFHGCIPLVAQLYAAGVMRDAPPRRCHISEFTALGMMGGITTGTIVFSPQPGRLKLFP